MVRGCAWSEGMCVSKWGGGMHGKGMGIRAGETATEAGGTHPAGRHSCSVTSDIKAVYVVMIVFVNSVAC